MHNKWHITPYNTNVVYAPLWCNTIYYTYGNTTEPMQKRPIIILISLTCPRYNHT